MNEDDRVSSRLGVVASQLEVQLLVETDVEGNFESLASMTSEQARIMATQLIEAADEIDGAVARTH